MGEQLQPLLLLEQVTYSKAEKVILDCLDMAIHRGQHWAISGQAGSGKSTLLELLKENHLIDSGRIQRNISPENIGFVGVKHDFKNLVNNKGFFYQQRYSGQYARESQQVNSYLQDKYKASKNRNYWTPQRVTTLLHLEHLLPKYLIQLSNGESKRLRIAAALLSHPQLLLLDQPYTGLDVMTRDHMEYIFSEISVSGITMVMTTAPDEIPDIVQNKLTLKLKPQSMDKPEESGVQKPNGELINKERLSAIVKPVSPVFPELVRMRDVRVKYGDLYVLRDINWEIQHGEKWALSGANGSGKSTLLSLIYADHPQAYGLDLSLFGTQRGKGESIWEIKQRIGFMSPELFQSFPTNYTCLQVVASGFHDTIGIFQRITLQEKQLANKWMQAMQINHLANKKLHEVSTTEQRTCLLTRALVKSPHLLILDEPCQGFDQEHQAHFRDLIDQLCQMIDMAIIYVTHHEETLPKCIEFRKVLP